MRLIILVLNLFLSISSFSQETVRTLNFNDVEPVFQKRCVGCHTTAATGTLDWSDYQTVFALKEQIYLRVVTLKNMPMYSKMPQEERDLISLWIEQGARK